MARRKKKVLVTNRSNHDLSKAEEFGELVYMSKGKLPRFGVNHMVRTFSTFINDSAPTDYILMTSLTVSCAIASALFAMKHNRLNFLLFKDGEYLKREVLLDGTCDE